MRWIVLGGQRRLDRRERVAATFELLGGLVCCSGSLAILSACLALGVLLTGINSDKWYID